MTYHSHVPTELDRRVAECLRCGMTLPQITDYLHRTGAWHTIRREKVWEVVRRVLQA